MTENRIRPIDDIRIELYDDNGMVDAYQGSGYHTVDEAIRNAFDGVRSEMNIEDYVFKVISLTTGTSARYRINAGGNVKILPEQ